MPETATIFAIVPAAGHSIRMGRPKLTLPIGNTTVIAAVIVAVRAAGVSRVLVVTAPHSSELVPFAESAGAEICALPAATPDMRATVQHGLQFIEDRYHPATKDFWMLIPADHPLVSPSVVGELLRASETHSGFSIYVPTYHGRRGHPALISWNHVNAIRKLSPDSGINSYLRKERSETLEVEVDDASILFDLNKPEDFAALVEQYRG